MILHQLGPRTSPPSNLRLFLSQPPRHSNCNLGPVDLDASRKKEEDPLTTPSLCLLTTRRKALTMAPMKPERLQPNRAFEQPLQESSRALGGRGGSLKRSTSRLWLRRPQRWSPYPRILLRSHTDPGAPLPRALAEGSERWRG